MKLLLSIILITTVSFCFSQNDSINKKDISGLKQGDWIFFYDSEQVQKKEEGLYDNNKKTGIWKAYYLKGNLKNEIIYIKNRPNGYAKFYYKSGKVSEEGVWKSNKWVGEYKYYHENGKPAYIWNYNESGKRTGEQKYFHENGKVMIEGRWQDGKEEGTIKEYNKDGKLIAEKTFADGKMDETTVKVYKIESTPSKVDTTTKISKNINKGPVDYFDGNGFYITYNKNKKIDREGNFKDGKFDSGKRYFYNPDQTLRKTVIYNNGNIVDVIYPKEKE